MRKFKKIWAKSEEKLCKAVVLYADTNSFLCTDAEKQHKVAKDDLVDLFKKGLVLVDAGEGTFHKPMTMTIADAYAAVSVVTVGSSTTTNTVFYSEGYTA